MSAAADRKLAGGGPEAIAARLRRQLAPDDVLAAVIAELVGHPAGPELASDQPMVGVERGDDPEPPRDDPDGYRRPGCICIGRLPRPRYWCQVVAIP
jgi:hypothetical protein